MYKIFILLLVLFSIFILFGTAAAAISNQKDILQNCDTCGHKIHKSAKSCPKCGNPDTSKDITIFGSIVWIAWAFMTYMLAKLNLFWVASFFENIPNFEKMDAKQISYQKLSQSLDAQMNNENIQEIYKNQISSCSPELQHGIFSFYLMKGMEGDADVNNDGKITAGEMQQYVSDKVQRQAMSMNRKQEPQLVGDANRVLVGR